MSPWPRSIHSFIRFGRFDCPEDRADLVQTRSAQQDILVDMQPGKEKHDKIWDQPKLFQFQVFRSAKRYCVAASTPEAQLVMSTLWLGMMQVEDSES